MLVVNIHEAKTNLSALLAKIEQSGEKVLVCRNGKPIAELAAHKPANRLKPHPIMKNIKILYDPVEPLTDDEWPGNTI